MPQRIVRLSESSGLALPLHKTQDVALADGTLHVTDDGSVWVVEELNTHLGHGTSVTGAAEDLIDLCKLDGLILLAKEGGRKARSREVGRGWGKERLAVDSE
jgi:hypothetical protein